MKVFPLGMLCTELPYISLYQYLAFSCGLVRGGLSNLGVKSIVTAEVSAMPACKCLFIDAWNLLHSLFYTKIYSTYLSFRALYTLKKGRPCGQPNLYLSIATLRVGAEVVVIDQQRLKLRDCYWLNLQSNFHVIEHFLVSMK